MIANPQFKTISVNGGVDKVKKLKNAPAAVKLNPAFAKNDSYLGNLSIIVSLPKTNIINAVTENAIIMLAIALIIVNVCIFYFLLIFLRGLLVTFLSLRTLVSNNSTPFNPKKPKKKAIEN